MQFAAEGGTVDTRWPGGTGGSKPSLGAAKDEAESRLADSL